MKAFNCDIEIPARKLKFERQNQTTGLVQSYELAQLQWAVVLAQLVKRSLLNSDVRGLNPCLMRKARR